MLVYGAGTQRGPDVVAHKFFAQIFDGRGGSASGERFFIGGLQVFLLANVPDHGDHFAVVVFLEPRDDDRGVEPARVGQDYLLGLWELMLVHGVPFILWSESAAACAGRSLLMH